MPSRCSRLSQEYQTLLVLRERFSVELEEAIATEDFTALALLKAEILEKKKVLEGELNPFESSLHIQAQYERQKQIYENIGLLEKREGILGMEGIDGKWYGFPSLSQVHRGFCAEREMLAVKTDQGFTKLLIVPFGMSLKKFIETMEKILRAHYVEMPDPANPGKMSLDPEKTRLFATKKDVTDPDEPLALKTAEPLWIRNMYSNTDTDGRLVYFPTVFDVDPKKHKGKTKKELLEDTRQGFQILLIEADPNIPEAGTNRIIGSKQPRKRLEAGDRPRSYLETLQTKPEYAHEEGLTPEAWMTQFLLHLEETNQVIDDCQGNGNGNLNLGGWFPDFSYVSSGCWISNGAQVNLGARDSGEHGSVTGSRSAVRI